MHVTTRRIMKMATHTRYTMDKDVGSVENMKMDFSVVEVMFFTSLFMLILAFISSGRSFWA